MRPLTDDEAKLVFEKLAKYIGENVKMLVDRTDGVYVFRLNKERVYYVSETIMKLCTNVARDNFISLGTCIGKFTKTKKFKLHITALDLIAPLAKYKVWVKPSAEQSFIYGNHVQKAGLGRITEGTPQYQGVVVYSMNDLPLPIIPRSTVSAINPISTKNTDDSCRDAIALQRINTLGCLSAKRSGTQRGFGATAKSTQDCRRADPSTIVVFHQADTGEYLRNEDTLT